MKSILAVLFFGAAAAGMFWWEARSGAKLPSWAFAIAAIPMVMIRFLSVRPNEDSDTASGLGLVFMFLGSVGLMLVGALGPAMRGTWGEILSPALPIGAIGFAITIIAAWWHFRD